MFWLVVLLGYLIGSIPTAYIAGKITTGQDIRRLGDANMGAGNAYRKLGHKTGIAVYFADVAKGALAVIIAQGAGVSQPYVLIAGAGVRARQSVFYIS
jgi:glycerol-3-phosphate acyltransferase PlsY